MHLEANGRRIEYRIVEPGGRRGQRDSMLVLMHEGLGSVSMWKDFPDALAAATGLGVLVYSRYGHGASAGLDGPRQVDYMHQEALSVLPQILTVLDIDQPVFVGHSDGASIAIIHAGGGHGAAGMVLLAPHVFVEDITLDAIAVARRSFVAAGLEERLARYHDHPHSMFYGWNDIWLTPEFRDWNIEAYAEAVSAPLLLIQSEKDPYGTLAQIDVIEQRANGPVQKRVFPGSSHSPHVDCRKETICAIREFVESLNLA